MYCAQVFVIVDLKFRMGRKYNKKLIYKINLKNEELTNKKRLKASLPFCGCLKRDLKSYLISYQELKPA